MRSSPAYFTRVISYIVKRFMKLTTGACFIKLITAVIYVRARAFVPGKPFQPRLVFLVKQEPTLLNNLSGAPL